MDQDTFSETRATAPAFLRFLGPVVEVLRDAGGSATASEVIEGVVNRLQVSADELAQAGASGRSRVRNHIDWARFYLSKAGLLDASSPRGVWTLAARGRHLNLDEDAVLALFRDVQERFRPGKSGDDIDADDPPPIPPQGAVEAEEDEVDEIRSPYDPAKTQILTKPTSIEQLAKRLGYGEIDLAPEFQRSADLWNDRMKSRLIESMLIRIPLPVFYFDASDDAKWLVVDGLQRLSTIRHFMVEANASLKLRLTGLEYLVQHNGKSFDELPRDLRRRIEETQVFVHLIQPGTPSDVKFNIFKRINTGGLVLTAQEIRHALFHKADGANELLRELSLSGEFLDATDGVIGRTRMLDREFVLHFVAFSLTPYSQYTEASMDAFLNRHMSWLNDKTDGPQRDDLRRRFQQAMRAARLIFGRDAFRKRVAPSDPRRPINKSLFEAWSVKLGNLEPIHVELLIARRELVEAKLMEALDTDREFEASVSLGTGDVAKVHKRFSTIERIVGEVLSNPSWTEIP